MRQATLHRKTRETDIKLELNLDGTGKTRIETGIGFFDHMLGHIAMHGLVDLSITARGDLHVDAHHTVEDVALVLGEAIDTALEQRAGIHRMASVYVPMDESLAFMAIDFSGRPYCVKHTLWNGPEVGGLPTSLVEHFFESLAVTARCNLHLRVLYGRDNHHQAEALFKAFGRVLDLATQIDPRRGSGIPSTKGRLT
ncbi:MAG: imidazoleglycerol-phosphate dehydratase HisB [Calditrichaeota bacterium]|nr:MAG: imidazoleglycerol-phosphate dehydratase HisB [Calditrichota bacterium]